MPNYDGEMASFKDVIKNKIYEIVDKVARNRLDNLSSSDVAYDNTETSLQADTVQEAIDETFETIPTDADQISYDNQASGLVATDVQAAIDEVAASVGPDPNKMDKEDPTGTGKFTLNSRMNPMYAGDYSFVAGDNNDANGDYSVAMGHGCVASGEAAQAFGLSTAGGNYSHAEGNASAAGGNHSHAEGYATRANGESSHAEGAGTKASSANQHVSGKYNIEDNADTYAEIIGNGTADNARSNARTLDWNGNETIAGDLYFNGGASPLSAQLAAKADPPSDYFDYYSTELPNKTSSSNSTTWSEFGRFAIAKGYWIITVAINYPKKAGGGRSVGLVYNTSNSESTTAPGGSTSQTVGSSGADVETNAIMTTIVNVTANGYIHIMGRQNSGGTISGTHYIRARGIKLM